MDYGLLGLLVVAAIVAGAFFVLRPRQVHMLDPLLSTLARIDGSPDLTAAQKRHEAEVAYRSYETSTVSLIGAVEDVFPNGSVVMRTSSRELPSVGLELERVTDAQLRAIVKGKAITLRARLPSWKKFADVEALPQGFKDGKVFYAGRWYEVKVMYRVKKPKELNA